VEFPNPPGHVFGDVHFTLHPSGTTVDYALGFDPCSAFHRYGFLWTPGSIVFTVDGKSVRTFSEGDLNTSATGFVMANAWTGNPNWGGGPPTAAAANRYAAFRYVAGATKVP
jgi:beta-glucanase (GH16 family)